jgi:hypothetical protein
MKKLVIILTAAVMLFSAFTFATDSDNVNSRVKTAFLKDFSTASDVSWGKTSNFYFANFTLNQVEVSAAYNEQGELVGTSRTLESTLLPLNISLALAKKYEGYDVCKKVLELTFEGETRYYVTIVNNSHILKLKCLTGGDIEVEKKIKKS